MADERTRNRKTQNVITAYDREELRKAYRFVPPIPSASDSNGTTWQERMARTYERHLYREFVLADLTQYKLGKVGMRWRTKDEVVAGKGFETCGNKHCPSYGSSKDVEAARRASSGRPSEDAVRAYISRANALHNNSNEEMYEMDNLAQVPSGGGLSNYEVNFAYQEGGGNKSELVKLRMCLRCAPMLFHGRGGSIKAKLARNALNGGLNGKNESTESTPMKSDARDIESDCGGSSRSSASSSSFERRRRNKQRRKEKQSKKERKSNKRDRCRPNDDGKSRKEKRRRRSYGSVDNDEPSVNGIIAEKELLASLGEI